jgi:cytochrome c
MNWLIRVMCSFYVVLVLAACAENTGEVGESIKPRILIFSKTAGFRHPSIEVGKTTISELVNQNGIEVELTEDAANFNEKNLQRFNSVVFLSTTGDVLNAYQQAEFERFIQAGGGYVGIHAATDTEFRWPWYEKLVGAYFAGHPKTQQATLHVTDRTHQSTQHLQQEWARFDEWYNFKSMNPDVNVLATLDESTYEGGKNGDHHPIAWYHEYDGGRALYTGGGHTEKSFSEPEFMQHLLGGILYSIGDAAALDYSKARSNPAMTENRLTKTVLDTYLNEPMELEVLDDGRVLFVERRGAVRLYDPSSNKTLEAGLIPVTYQNEDGLLGLALDPNFSQNGWVYFYYSAVADNPVQHVSRMTFAKGKVDLKSEKILLKVPVQHGDACCHAGGALEFGPKGHLFISTGDNTNPFTSQGFSPVDERPGRLIWDAQRSAGNSNDLRGKILRIHPEADGTYTIPKGNLFTPGTHDTRPEIYTMGNRNPFRMSIDSQTGYLYWGEVGPDSGKDNAEFGPRGFDEINQAREAGFFGWPYFIADNQPYKKYDFVNDKVGRQFNNVAKPENTSPNNTGLRALPSPQPASIWYPSAKSDEFSEVGMGGRTAMAGPVFYSDDYSESEEGFPDYYNGKLFIYEWSRNWIKVVSMDEDGRFLTIEPFMPFNKLVKPIDMQFGTDGTLYVLEYGSAWNQKNQDSRLIRIHYVRGNRAPIADIKANAVNGAAPLSVEFSAKASMDYDSDSLSYHWTLDGKPIADVAEFSHNFEHSGVNQIQLTVNDGNGQQDSKTISVAVGNKMPELSLTLKSQNGNTRFFWPNIPIDYQLTVVDKEDGSLADGGIKAEDIHLSYEFIPDGIVPEIGAEQSTSILLRYVAGLEEVESGGCKACHALNSASVGPSFTDVAKRYAQVDDHTRAKLIEKIQNGGNGNWGEQAMPANPQSTESVSKMLDYILSLVKSADRLPLDGQLMPTEGGGENDWGTYVVKLSYQDRGGDAPALRAYQQQELRSTLPAHHADVVHKAKKGKNFVGWVQPGAYVLFKNLDLTDIKQLRYQYGTKFRNGRIEARIGAPDGQLLGSVQFSKTGGYQTFQTVSVAIEPVDGLHDIYFVLLKEDDGPEEHLVNLKGIQFLPHE